ncbi:YggS family pyridoxal phosphate-dependent enzyme [Nevskia soli]|uniref:YggS family pyridoxal phosphate-dependent enzyme n=1 Tax=Nevskia soli TaxID=418856 RepID=UPI001C5CAE66|nr:YggS family pyridoxal phosphate-dependent enzyme [Nevskia soli]
MESVGSALERVRERMAKAAARSGRSLDEITLLGVTKIFPAAVVRAGYEAGLREFGENYVQEFESKSAELGDLPGARFHLIGHLQSNKTRKAAELFQVIQSVDSAKLARRLNEAGSKLDIYIEVKTSDETSKSGADETDLPAIVDAVRASSNLSLLGLMTVPQWSEDAEQSRPAFAHLRELAGRYGLSKLSMGMSNDFEVAIEEGATLIRVGTAIFGRRAKPA